MSDEGLEIKKELYDQLGITENMNVKPEAASEAEEESPYSSVEQDAMKLGWKPEGVAGRKHKPADEWMDDYSLYKKINDLGKQVQEKNSVLENVAKHLESVREASYSQAKREHDEEIQHLRHLALNKIQEGEWAGEEVIAAFENDLQSLKQKYDSNIQKLAPLPPAAPSREDTMAKLNPSERSFVQKYEHVLFSDKSEDVAVQAFVANRHNELLKDMPEAESRIEVLEKELAMLFPNKFTGNRRVKSAGGKVESASVGIDRGTGGLSKKNLTKEEREILTYFVENQGVDENTLLQQFQLVRNEQN